MGSNFVRTAEHLKKAGPVEKSLAKSKKMTISSTLAGKGDSTGVEFRWYTFREYKDLSNA